MNWITREKPKIDRIACPWLIRNFIDKEARFIYVPFNQVLTEAEKINATVTEIIPGYMDTDMAKGNRLFWVASLEKASRQIMNAIAKKKKRVFVTKRWWLIYHVSRWMPSFIYDRLINSGFTLKKK